jgi:GTP cyclohydrolase I
MLRPTMTNLTDALHIPDPQATRDHRRLAIQRVGVKGVRWPASLSVAGAEQATIATWALDVALPAEAKGTHMSRFVAWLDTADEEAGGALDVPAFTRRHAQMLERLEATEGRAEARFTFFVRKRAPVSGVASLLDYEAALVAETRGGRTVVEVEVGVPVKTLCPCSKEISEQGAHNQRSRVTIRAALHDPLAAPVPWHELVRFAEDEASCELWPLLKRADEKWVTERAYDRPKFVEDLVRDVALRVQADARIGRCVVEVENFESIHNHSAYARIERG